MEDSSKQRRRFQFSLREYFLATIALCAVIALFVKKTPLGTASFANGLDARALVTDCATQAGVMLEIGGSGEGSFGSDQYANREASISIRQPAVDEFRLKVMPVVRDRVKEMLEDDGWDLLGWSRSPSVDRPEVQEFSFRYRRQDRLGVIRVYSLDQPGGEHRVLLLVDEW
jgi:hypothetical protein